MEVSLHTLVSVLVDLVVDGEPVVLRCAPLRRPEELLAFLLFRRAWPWGLVVCRFERVVGAN